jgi:hypothetical protein
MKRAMRISGYTLAFRRLCTGMKSRLKTTTLVLTGNLSWSPTVRRPVLTGNLSWSPTVRRPVLTGNLYWSHTVRRPVWTGNLSRSHTVRRLVWTGNLSWTECSSLCLGVVVTGYRLGNLLYRLKHVTYTQKFLRDFVDTFINLFLSVHYYFSFVSIFLPFSALEPG